MRFKLSLVWHATIGKPWAFDSHAYFCRPWHEQSKWPCPQHQLLHSVSFQPVSFSLLGRNMTNTVHTHVLYYGCWIAYYVMLIGYATCVILSHRTWQCTSMIFMIVHTAPPFWPVKLIPSVQNLLQSAILCPPGSILAFVSPGQKINILYKSYNACNILWCDWSEGGVYFS